MSSELRLYTTVFMVSIVLVWFVLGVLKGRRDHSTIGVLTTDRGFSQSDRRYTKLIPCNKMRRLFAGFHELSTTCCG